METVQLISADTGLPTQAEEDKFGNGLHGFDFVNANNRTTVPARWLDAHQQEKVNLVLQERPLEVATDDSGDTFYQMRDVINAKALAVSACNYSTLNAAALATFRAAIGAGNAIVYVGSSGRTATFLGNHTVLETSTGGGHLLDVGTISGDLVASDEAGDIYASTDTGASWNVKINPTGVIRHWASGGGKLIGVGDNGSIVSTTDASIFSDESIGGADDFVGLAWDPYNEVFVAVQNGAFGVYTSTGNGVWTLKQNLTSTPKAVAASNKFCHILLSSGSIARSLNGFDSFGTLPVGIPSPLFMASDPTSGCLVAFTSLNTVYISLNGVLFRPRPMNAPFSFPSPGLTNAKVRLVNGRFCLPGDNDQLMASMVAWR